MQVRSDRRYVFEVEPDVLWERISDTASYQRWWPWLRRFEGGGLVGGACWRCTVQPPLPYVLDFTVALDEVTAPRLVRATVSGDLTGGATLEVGPARAGSEAHFVSALAPRNRFLQAVAVAARPMVRFGHDWVFDTGARQFAERAV